MYYVIRKAHFSGDKIAEYSKHIKACKPDELPSDAELVFRWGTTGRISSSVKVVNKASAIEETSNKKTFRLKLDREELCPRTWGSYMSCLEWLHDERISEFGGLKFLIRPAHHLRSEDMTVVDNRNDLKTACEAHPQGYYISEFIEKKREFRVYVVSNRIVAIIEKIPQDRNAISWGCVTQGEFEYVDWTSWPIPVAMVAVRSVAASSLDFGAVDIITDESGRAYTLEVNTAPQLTPYPAKKFAAAFDWMIDNNRDRFDVPTENLNSWKSYAHPSLGASA